MIDNKLKIFDNEFYLKKITINNISKNYFNWFNNFDVKKYIKSSYDSQNDLLAYIKKEIKKKNQIFFGIFLKKNNLHIGNVKFHDIDLKKKISWVGILIGEKKFRSQSFGRKSIYKGCEFLFLNFCIKKFYLKVDKENLAAIKSYKQIGFKVISTSKNEFLMSFNFVLNKLILGTAQFGQPYGISNNKPITKKNISDILKISKNKVSQVDTSEDYLIDSNTKKKLGSFMVNTKVHISFFFKPYYQIEKEIKKISKYYKVNILFIRELEDNFRTARILKKIKLLKKKKFINKIGISIYSTKNIVKLHQKFKYDAIQAPVNIFDNRCDKFENFFKRKQIEFHARSVFLQGLFFMDEKSLKKKLIGLKPFIKKLSGISKKLRINMYDLALSHVFLKNYVDKVIIGAHKDNQIIKCLNFNFNRKSKEKLKFKIKDDKLIDPRYW